MLAKEQLIVYKVNGLLADIVKVAFAKKKFLR